LRGEKYGAACEGSQKKGLAIFPAQQQESWLNHCQRDVAHINRSHQHPLPVLVEGVVNYFGPVEIQI